ncbi:MAG: D-glycerate dehydrogenase [Polyangiaceae bacterium]
MSQVPGVLYFSQPFPGAPLERLEPHGHVVVGTKGIYSPSFAEHAPNIIALMTVMGDRIDAALLEQLPRLRVVANIAVGYDNIDVAACKARGVMATNTSDAPALATADITLGLILAVARRMVEADRFVRAGKWSEWTPTLMMGKCVHELVLGIVGFGRIGRAVAARARGFGMRVLYTQRTRLSREEEVRLGVEFRPFDLLLREAECVTVHAPLGPETRGLFGAPEFAQMQKGAFFINTSRVGLVDEDALVEALAAGHLGGAGLDVFANEPSVPEALMSMPNVVLCPHIGSADDRTRARMATRSIDNAIRVISGLAPLDPLWNP